MSELEKRYGIVALGCDISGDGTTLLLWTDSRVDEPIEIKLTQQQAGTLHVKLNNRARVGRIDLSTFMKRFDSQNQDTKEK